MAQKKYDVYEIVGAFNRASVQIDRDWDMNRIRDKLTDVSDEVSYWDDYTTKQRKRHLNERKNIDEGIE